MPPPKRVKQTDAIFEQLKVVNPEADRAGDTLRISIDAKATVNIGPFSPGPEPHPDQGGGPRLQARGHADSIRHLPATV